jgi:hypothetical protein
MTLLKNRSLGLAVINFGAKTLKLCLAVMVCGLMIGVGGVVGEDEAPNPNADVATGSTAGETGARTKTTELSENSGKLFDRKRQEREFSIRGAQGWSGLADSKDAKELVRSLITSQMTTMFQTVTMVENGAAFGLANGLNTATGLLNSITNSAHLDYVLKGQPETTQQLRFINGIHKGMRKQKKNKDSAIAGILWTSNDTLKNESTYNSKLEEFTERKPGELNMSDSLYDESDQAESADAPETPGPEKISLVKTLLEGNGTDSGKPGSEGYAKEYIGDLEYENIESGARTVTNVEPKSATKSERVAGNLVEQARGLQLRTAELQREVWDAFSAELLKKYCEFKTSDGNYEPKPFDKSLPSKVVTQEMLDKASSKTIKLTINLVDQIFKVYASQRPADPSKPTTINCNVFKNHQEAMPTKYEELESGKGPDCMGEPKKCNQNKWLFILTNKIAIDRAISEFRLAYEKLIDGALSQNPIFLVKVHEYMCASLKARGGLAGVGQLVMCDPAVWLEGLATKNREEWIRQVEEFAKWAQNIGGASNLGFAGSNSIAQAGGDMGDVSSPPAGGGGGSGS